MPDQGDALRINICRADAVVKYCPGLGNHRFHVLAAVIAAALAAARIVKADYHISVLGQLTRSLDKDPVNTDPVADEPVADDRQRHPVLAPSGGSLFP
ncbi:hypothetical protein D3C81_1928440 [compost metagenome]